MSDSQFRAVLDSLSRAAPSVDEEPSHPQSVAVLGAGPVGLLLACECLAAGLRVRLASLYGDELRILRAAGAITVRGEHLVGSYAVADKIGSTPAVEIADSIDEAVAGAEVIFIATPAIAHTTYAGVLAPVLESGQTVILVPGRFLGSVDFTRTLSAHLAPADVTIGELAHAPYVATSSGAAVHVFAVTKKVGCATLPVESASELCRTLAQVLPMLHPVDSPLDTAFGTVTGVLNVAPLATNVGVFEAKDDPSLKTLVTPGLSRTILRRLDTERREVAFRYGVRDLVSVATWLRESFGDDGEVQSGDDIHEALDGIESFDDVKFGWDGAPQVFDDVANVLVPLASAGRIAGVPTPVTDMVIALASTLSGTDLQAEGRSFERLGLAGHAPADLRRHLASLDRTRTSAATNWQKV